MLKKKEQKTRTKFKINANSSEKNIKQISFNW